MCIDNVKIWFGIADWKISSIFGLSARDMPMFSSLDNNLSKNELIFTKLCVCIDIGDLLFLV